MTTSQLSGMSAMMVDPTCINIHRTWQDSGLRKEQARDEVTGISMAGDVEDTLSVHSGSLLIVQAKDISQKVEAKDM